ncbi:unnamed protein product [Symbiodinium natans]|uniref:Uncharacterized protein n=1 Tax=Symbiodinium natans TaxID=878477 RepID=A0A812IJU4_9DINO|nr:unnamed protein product [Symbiodinium natans]
MFGWRFEEVQSEENSFAIQKCQTMPELPVLDLTWAPAPLEEEHEEEEETKEGVALDVQCRPMPLLPSLGIEPESDMEALREKPLVSDRVDKCTPTPLPMKDMVTSGDAGDHAPLTQVPVPAAPAQRPDPSSWPFPARMVQEQSKGAATPASSSRATAAGWVMTALIAMSARPRRSVAGETVWLSR